MINISKPILGGLEEKAVIAVLKSGKLTQGKLVEKFEKNFAKYTNTKYAIATSSGTTALYLALLGLEIGKGDEVITTPFSFISTANSILHTGAKPVFVDIDEKTFNIDPNLIERKITRKTRAILPVHLFGLPANMDKIMKIAKKYNLWVIEDACQAHGASIDSKKVGSFGIAGCFSFYATKNMTTGEGGMITTNNKKLAKKIVMLRSHGSRKKYYHDILGFNFRMTEIEAALGLQQLKKIEKFNSMRINNARYLTDNLSNISGIITPAYPENFHHVFHQYTIKVTHDYRISRKNLMEKLMKAGIYSSIYYPIPIYKQKIYNDLSYHDYLPIVEKTALEVLSIPIHPGLKKQDLEAIAYFFHD